MGYPIIAGIDKSLVVRYKLVFLFSSFLSIALIRMLLRVGSIPRITTTRSRVVQVSYLKLCSGTSNIRKSLRLISCEQQTSNSKEINISFIVY